MHENIFMGIYKICYDPSVVLCKIHIHEHEFSKYFSQIQEFLTECCITVIQIYKKGVKLYKTFKMNFHVVCQNLKLTCSKLLQIKKGFEIQKQKKQKTRFETYEWHLQYTVADIDVVTNTRYQLIMAGAHMMNSTLYSCSILDPSHFLVCSFFLHYGNTRTVLALRYILNAIIIEE